ncbi:MAG TPA: efflux RND transporter periplasmic adaptor subunit [Chryseolinea sp.]|nr:efflux RND transporter periplasmic adaptor subunit [Chryseolinea sp.]
MKNVLQKLSGFALLGLMIVALQSCTDGKGATHAIPKASEAIPVRVTSLVPSSGHTVIKASGQLTTDDETVLGFKTAGIISRVFVREGDAVRKGQLLATLDLTEINAAVAQARMGAEKAQRDFKRASNLYADSVATLEQFQNAETAVAMAGRQLEAAEFNRSYSEIHAPADGFVLKKFVNAGQVVSTGDPVLITNAVSLRGWVLKVGVSDRQWSRLRVGDEATVHIDAFPGKAMKGKVARKSETADPASGSFVIEVSVQSEDLKLATGMFGAAEFTMHDGGSVWSVPFEAVLDAHDKEGFVFITTDGKTAHRQAVVIESFDDQHVRVSAGLESGQQLIVSGSAYLTDGSLIRLVK